MREYNSIHQMDRHHFLFLTADCSVESGLAADQCRNTNRGEALSSGPLANYSSHRAQVACRRIMQHGLLIVLQHYQQDWKHDRIVIVLVGSYLEVLLHAVLVIHRNDVAHQWERPMSTIRDAVAVVPARSTRRI
jgi:hypothetical protein